MASGCLSGCSTSQHFKHFFGRELTPEVRLLQEKSFDNHINSLFSLWLVKSGFPSGHRSHDWHSYIKFHTVLSANYYLHEVHLIFTVRISADLCSKVRPWHANCFFFFSLFFRAFFNYNPFRWCWMVFITLEVNEKINYIHIQQKKLKRGEISQGNCSRLHVF